MTNDQNRLFQGPGGCFRYGVVRVFQREVALVFQGAPLFDAVGAVRRLVELAGVDNFRALRVEIRQERRFIRAAGARQQAFERIDAAIGALVQGGVDKGTDGQRTGKTTLASLLDSVLYVDAVEGFPHGVLPGWIALQAIDLFAKRFG